MKPSHILWALPEIILVLVCHLIFLFLCVLFAASIAQMVDDFKGKHRLYDVTCGMLPLFIPFWLIGFIFFCMYWGNKLYEWGY
jgi:hypothetical protein